MSERLSLSTAERWAATTTAAAAVLVVAAYLIDRAGGAFRPLVMLPLALATAAICWRRLRRVATSADSREVTPAFALIVGGSLGWLLWISRPSFLPLGTGPDLTHHLLLIGYIEQHWRLVHDPALERFLGEMMHYTPGSHILATLAGAWSGSNGLHALHPVLSGAVALSAGFVFLIGVRTLPADVPRVPIAAIGAVALFASQTFLLGPFLEYSFAAQVVAQFFAVAMWWAIALWDRDAGMEWPVIIGLLGAALFLTWPVLIGPPLLLLGIMTLVPGERSFVNRVTSAAVAGAIVTLVAVLFMAGRAGWLQLAGTGGKTAVPSIAGYGWPLLAVSAAGALIAAGRRESWSTPFFGGAILLQAAALYVVAARAGNAPYMALKMFYLLIFVQGAAVSAAVAALWHLAARLTARSKRTGEAPRASLLAWALAALVLVAVARPLAGAPKSLRLIHAPATTAPLEQAGLWARAHLPAACVEYLVPDDESAYWLHLAVLGNPRMSARTGDNSTYELSESLVRWLTPGGLPYAIVDLPAVPRDIREELDVVMTFDTAAVARRRGPSSCPPQ